MTQHVIPLPETGLKSWWYGLWPGFTPQSVPLSQLQLHITEAPQLSLRSPILFLIASWVKGCVLKCFLRMAYLFIEAENRQYCFCKTPKYDEASLKVLAASQSTRLSVCTPQGTTKLLVQLQSPGTYLLVLPVRQRQSTNPPASSKLGWTNATTDSSATKNPTKCCLTWQSSFSTDMIPVTDDKCWVRLMF